MTPRTRLLSTVLFAALLVGIHFDFKRDFDPQAVQQFADEVSGPALWVNKAAPDFEEPLLDGTPFHLADHIGKQVVILNFFASWCEPCRQEMPELDRFRKSELGRSVLFVGIDAAEERPAVDKLVKDFAIDFPVIIDHPNGVRTKYGVKAYPTTVLIDAQGKITLYETSAIMNADVSLGAPVRNAAEALRRGHAATKEIYLETVKQENYRQIAPTARRTSPELTGRGRTIADKMFCLCGCSKKLLDCECKTATGMKGKLKAGGWEAQSDQEVMQSLGKEFCMGGM